MASQHEPNERQILRYDPGFHSNFPLLSNRFIFIFIFSSTHTKLTTMVVESAGDIIPLSFIVVCSGNNTSVLDVDAAAVEATNSEDTSS
jgi:hypothetical protein